MKTNLLGTFVAAALAATTAFAQNTTMLKADVPFDFTAGSQTFQAGRYTVDRGAVPGAVTIRSDDGRKAAIVLTEPASSVNPRDNGSLVFHRYGRAYFLSEIRTPGYEGRRLPPTKSEHEAAASLTAPVATTVAAVR